MRWLIDGYNLMFAGGLLGRRLGPDGLRKVRHRFLNDLADRLGAVDAHATTIVFDASRPPDAAAHRTPHKGLTVLYAHDVDDADTRLEQLIAAHSFPKGLTVVSSDRRVRQAATRRKARSVSAEDFWVELDARRRARDRQREREGDRDRPRPASATPARPAPADDRPTAIDPAEAAFWLEEFAELDHQPETREALNPDPPMLTDDEIARLQREIDAEMD